MKVITRTEYAELQEIIEDERFVVPPVVTMSDLDYQIESSYLGVLKGEMVFLDNPEVFAYCHKITPVSKCDGCAKRFNCFTTNWKEEA